MSKIVGVHVPSEVKNYAINGNFDYWQENIGNTVTVNTATAQSAYSSDMFKYFSNGATVKNYSLVRSTDVPTFSQSGFNSNYSNLFTMITGIASPAAADYVLPHSYLMEGLDYAKIHGRTVTFGFWVKASVAGTYSFSLGNPSGTRSYVTIFAINSSNTWEFKSITVVMDNTGTWNFDANSALFVYIGGITGSTYQTSTLGSWQSGAFFSASTGTNWQATSGATLRIAQVSIVEGSLGFGPTGFQRAGKTIQQELAFCQRYYEKTFPVDSAVGGEGSMILGKAESTTDLVFYNAVFKIQKRAVPAITLYSRQGTINAVGPYNSTSDTSISFDATSVQRCNTWGFQRVAGSGFTAGTTYWGHYVADSRL